VFGNFRYAHTNYYADNEIGFEHLFLKVGVVDCKNLGSVL
jgi:hypothetical protein